MVLSMYYIHETFLVRPYFGDNLLCRICLFQDSVYSRSTTS